MLDHEPAGWLGVAGTGGRNYLRGTLNRGTWETVPVISRRAGARGIMHVQNTFALGVTKRIRPVPRTWCAASPL